MWSPVNLLKHSAKISDMTKREVSILDFSDIHEKVAKKNRRADFSSVLDPLTCWLPKTVLKQQLWCIQEDTFSAVNNFGNI